MAKPVSEWATTVQVQMKPQLSDPVNLISTIGFLGAFQISRDNNGNQEGAAVRLGYVFTKKVAAEALTACILLKGKALYSSVKEGVLKLHVQSVSHMFAIYAPYDITAKTGTKIVHFRAQQICSHYRMQMPFGERH